MQCYPPPTYYGCPNGQPMPFATIQNSFAYPRVIGEGDIASVMLPDGTTQTYFVPAATRQTPSSYYPNTTNYISPSPWNSNVDAWYIRGNTQPTPGTIFHNPQPQPVFRIPSRPFCSSADLNCNVNPGYQLKFHNDNCTSTTDIHYFYPSLRYCSWFPKPCAAVQAVQPAKSCTVLCTKPCHCTTNKAVEIKSEEPSCKCNKKCACCNQDISKCDSKMSVESDNIDKQCQAKSKCNNSKHSKKQKLKNHECKCESPAPLKCDKAVVTFADKKTGCNPENGRETQTDCYKVCPVAAALSSYHVNEVTTELWFPKTPFSKRAMQSKTSMIADTCESDCCCSEDGGCDSEPDSEPAGLQ